MAKMTKAQSRKRLAEAASKVAHVFVEGDQHLSTACLTKLFKIRNELLNLSKKLK